MNINAIIVEDRFRRDMGDVAGMAASIKEFNLIQPIVVVHAVNKNGETEFVDPDIFRLVAGGRRIAAMRLLGWTDLEVGRHVIIRDEAMLDPTTKLRVQSMELEENLRRKEMTWPEQVEAKKKLFDLMESIYGPTSKGGGMTRAERREGAQDGFGVRKLAAMLGESPATVSADLQLAKLVEAMPHLKSQESKSSASRIGTVSLALMIAKNEQTKRAAAAVASATASPNALKPEAKYDLYEGRWQDSIHLVPPESIDLVYTDLPYGTDLDEMLVAGASDTSSGHSGAITYTDKREDIVNELPALLSEAFRVLRPDRFAVLFFGFNFYTELVIAARSAGFSVNCVPVVWIKHSQSAIAPTMRYANGYEQALVIMKGSPRFIRPGQPNIVDIPKIASGERMQVAQQPVPLVERFIGDMTLPIGARVLDFCSGVGTTGVAALKTNRYPVLFEKDPQQCLLIRQRLSR